MEATVTLETKCWEKDWRLLLRTNRLRLLGESNHYQFTDQVLLINNVKNYKKVTSYAKLAIERGWISRYVVVKDYAEEAMRFFQLTPALLGRGYVYSIAELVGIYICESEFLLHFAGDCIPSGTCDWIAKALCALVSDDRIKVANLTWNNNYEGVRGESHEETSDFYIGSGFSDQCYLIRVSDFRAAIYNEYHPDSERYPAYAGELFEKRVDSWMRSHGHLRATYRHGSYLHHARPTPLCTRFRRLASRITKNILHVSQTPI